MPPDPLRGALLALLLTCAPLAQPAGPALRLHVPSPDWRDQIIYFVVTDRFADGDAANNDQGAGEFKAGDPSRYNGGDLAGLVQRLDYIRGLGATALWITPPVANQWLNPAGNYSGYHGYWAENFMQVDRHLGTLADYQRLSHALHSTGMYLVQDIVVNHMGNYFTYRDRWAAGDPARGWEAHDTSPPVPRPSQPPFDRNDPRDPAQRRAGIYHWTPDITDYGDRSQEHGFQMAGLDDLNTESPVVRAALRRSYGHWIREVGVDALRIDTAFYVPPEYFADFMGSTDPRAPGMAEVARRTGRKQFLAFGEGFGIDKPGEDAQSRKIERYMTGQGGRPLLPGMLNFPLYGALGDAFARGRPPAELGRRIEATMTLHARPHLMPSFVDNHDVDRFLAGGSEAGLRQALLALMTLPGIPVIYYGTEQGFTQPRAAMFKAGWGSQGRDHYDTGAPLYRAIAGMSALRREHRVLSRGVPKLLQANEARPGALAWRMDHEGEAAFVVFNTADSETLLPNLATGLPEGAVLEGLFGLDGRPAELVAGRAGRLSLRLPPRSGQVWRATGRRNLPAAAAAAAASLTLDLPAAARLEGDFGVSGRAEGVARLQLVVDGDLATAQQVVPNADGRWQAVVDTGAMADPDTRHSVSAWAEGQATSEARSFQVVRAWRELADVTDPPGDDAGPAGRYVYPTDPGWGAHRQMDLRRVRAWGSGGALRLDLTMNEVTQTWSPAHGFDHVAFTVFIELPGRPGGATVMPLQGAQLPAGMRWHLRLRAHGWSNALFSAEGASATQEGKPVTPAAGIRVDRAARTVSFTLPAAALGGLGSLSGVKIYVTTWDYDGGYRPLAPLPQPFAIGGGPADGVKVMDDSPVITLP
ncbi:MAG: alpha-amylase family glycosyl hydrolase [Rubrivivax sp.]|nr:alpha-amylase family glycosyl hydrolase [Rubrivivax sp.]